VTETLVQLTTFESASLAAARTSKPTTAPGCSSPYA